MRFDWSEYDNDSGVESIPLSVSMRSQSLALAALQVLEQRSNWLTVSDATWNIIDKAVGEAYQEIIKEVAPMPSAGKAFTLERTTTSFTLNFGAWQSIPMSLAQNPDGLAEYSGGDFNILESGLYAATLMLSVRNAATASSLKLCRLRNTTQGADAILGVSQNFAAGAIERAWLAISGIFECNAGDNLDFQIYSVASNATVESDGTIGSLVSRCLVAKVVKIHD